jgi:NAD+ diphosphatase
MTTLRQPQNFYAGNDFNRLAERRTDSDWIGTMLLSEQAAILPLWNGRSLVAGGSQIPKLTWITPRDLSTPPAVHQVVLLGEFRGRTYFATDVKSETPPVPEQHGEFHDLRLVGGLMDRHEAGLLGYARALLMWHDKHRFCGKCGSPTALTSGGHVLKCSNTSCGLSHFPRLDPAIIVLVTDGERVLLGRQAQWPQGRYSTIAGFIEWAESIEEAVAREVREETGILIDEVEYHSSQPWPFPSSLMLGFIAHACSVEVERIDMELEDARWFSRDDIAQGAIILPPAQALSYRLIETWYDRGAGKPLHEELDVKAASFAQPGKS